VLVDRGFSAGLLQRNFDAAEVRSELHPCPMPLQSNGHTFFIPQVQASRAANQCGTETDGAVGAGKVVRLNYT
jgi:hypothetical protein